MEDYDYIIRAVPVGGRTGDNVPASTDLLVFSSTGDRLFLVQLRLADSMVFEVAQAIGVAAERARLEVPPEVNEAILLAGLRRVREELRLGDLPPDPPQDPYRISFNGGDVAFLADEARQKLCSYQQRDGRDIFCSAAAFDDRPIAGRVGLRTFARTAPRICNKCNMPDDRLLCRHLLNAEVKYRRAHEPFGRELRSADCELGHHEVATPRDCRAGGHSCWEIAVSREAPSIPAERRSPRALVEALGYFDASWRLAFGSSQRIVHLRDAETTVRLAENCDSAEEFDSRMSALSMVLDDLTVSDDLWAEGLTTEERASTKSLTRLELALKKSGLEPEGLARASQAISTLHALKKVRNKLHHSRDEVARAFRQANLSFPPRWQESWEMARAMAAQAISVIREEIASLSTRKPASRKARAVPRAAEVADGKKG